jgi:hypothetical protein
MVCIAIRTPTQPCPPPLYHLQPDLASTKDQSTHARPSFLFTRPPSSFATPPPQRPRHQRSHHRPSASPPRDAGPPRRTSAQPVQHSAQRRVSCICACHPRGPRNVYVQRFRGVRLRDGLNHDGWCLQRARDTATRLAQGGGDTRGAVFGASCLRCVTVWGWMGGVGTFWGSSIARAVFV